MRFEELRERNPERDSEELEKLELIRSMQAEGKSYRQIAEVMGYKSHASVREFVMRFEN